MRCTVGTADVSTIRSCARWVNDDETMIEVTIAPTLVRVGAPTRVVFTLHNASRGTCTNLNGRLSLPHGLLLVGGRPRITVPRLDAGQSDKHDVVVEASAVGEFRIEIVNFSYEDPGGKPRRMEGWGRVVEALPALPASPPAERTHPAPSRRRDVFVSYRWTDAEGWANYVHEKLRHEFGASRVFLDRTDQQPGEDFRLRIEEALRATAAMVVLVGPDWNPVTDRGLRRLDDEDDFVRKELRYAVDVGVGIVPVLVEGATMPSAATLPTDIREFAYRTTCVIHQTRFEDDMRAVVTALRAFVR